MHGTDQPSLSGERPGRPAHAQVDGAADAQTEVLLTARCSTHTRHRVYCIWKLGFFISENPDAGDKVSSQVINGWFLFEMRGQDRVCSDQ